MSIAQGMAIKESMVQVVARASLDRSRGRSQPRPFSPRGCKNCQDQGWWGGGGGGTCRHCFTCGSADHFKVNCGMTGEQGNEMWLFQREGK